MSQKTYRVGIIGCGRMGSTIDDEVRDYPPVQFPYSHAAGYAAVPECRIVAAADINEEALAAFGSRWGTQRLYTDFRTLLQAEALDIVSVTTRATERAAIIREAIKQGVRAIFAEKALAISLAEADELVELAESTGTVLAVNCSRRWHPKFMQAEQMIREDAIGKVRYVYGSCPGGMSHSGSHAIDVMRMLAGSDVEWVMGHTSAKDALLDDDLSGNGYMQFTNGAVGFYNAMATSQVEFDVIGTKGRLRATANGMYWEYQTFTGPRRLPEGQPLPPVNRPSATVNAIKDIIECLENGGTPRCSVRDGRAALEIAIAIRESERRGGMRITLPLEDRSLTMTSR